MRTLKINKLQPVTEDLLNTLYFPSSDVLYTLEDRQNRAKIIHHIDGVKTNQAPKLRIKFEDIEGAKMIELNQWEKSEREIITPSSGFIPIHRIKSIQIIE